MINVDPPLPIVAAPILAPILQALALLITREKLVILLASLL